MSESPISLRDATGVERFRGTQSPGGGSQPVQAVYSGNAVTIVDQNGAQLTFDSLDSGTELLDRTTPDIPLLLEAGTYLFVATCYASTPLTAGGHASTTANIGSNAGNSDSENPNSPFSAVSVAIANAGDPVTLLVNNFDGAASRDYQLYGAVLVKLA